ncbi:hypothetical protein D3C80_1795840 [compost metagenome]
MPGARHPHVQPLAGGLADHAAQLILACRSATGRADAGLVADPVTPMRMLESELVDVHVVRRSAHYCSPTFRTWIAV